MTGTRLASHAPAVLLCGGGNERPPIEVLLRMALPRASISRVDDAAALAEGALPDVDAAVITVDTGSGGAVETLRLLRARGFLGAIVVVAGVREDSALESAVQAAGAVSVPRTSVDKTPLALASALDRAASGNAAISVEIAYARRVFAAGQMALSLQHSINNPLAALLAETQLLQLEELTEEQRGSVDRMLELCRRVVALVRRLDGIASVGE